MPRVSVLIFSLTMSFAFVAGHPALSAPDTEATTTIQVPDASSLNYLGTTKVTDLMGRIVKAALGIAGTIALVMFVAGGVLMMISGGEADRFGKGKDMMVWSGLGVVVILSSVAIVSFILEAVK